MSDSVTVLVAEDDPKQLEALVAWISQIKPEWRVVGQALDVPTLLDAIENLAPELLIVDIHMPGGEPEDFLAKLPAELPIIFVTGDPQFAVTAFELSAVDYMVKPYSFRRLKQALEKAEADPRLKKASPGMRSAGGGAEPGSNWITMSRGNELVIVSEPEIVYLQADLKYTRIVSTRGDGLVRTGVSELTARLDPNMFAKIHRSIVVNLAYVAAVRRSELGHMEVHLKGRSEVLKVSKSYQQVFKTL